MPFATVDEYIASFPDPVRELLSGVRRAIHAAVPGAGEKISYQVPAITVNGKAVAYFAGWKTYLSFYPVPAVDDATAAELAPYRAAKSTLRFPIDQPVPYDLIGRLAAGLAGAPG